MTLTLTSRRNRVIHWKEKRTFSVQQMMEKYGITVDEIDTYYEVWDRINDRNGLVHEVHFKKKPNLANAIFNYSSLGKYGECVKRSRELQGDKQLYSWYVELMDRSVHNVIETYKMDHVMVLDYLLQHRRKPDELSERERSVMSLSGSFYLWYNWGSQGVNKESEWVTQPILWFCIIGTVMALLGQCE